MKALLYVRSVVADHNDRAAFDDWYGSSHSLEGVQNFGFLRFWRCWSHLDPSVHYAFYELEDTKHYDRIVNTPAFAEMVADFTEVWGDRVTRERDVVNIVHEFSRIRTH